MTARSAVLTILVLAGLTAPAISAATTLPQLRYEKYELPNGLDVILYEDHSTPIVAVNVWYHVGSRYEKPGRTGFAHLFEHMMFQGSLHHDHEYFAPLEKVGAFVNGSTSEDRTNYITDVPSNYLELALWLDSDRMGHLLPAMTQEKLDNQRDVVKNERRQGLDNQPYAKAEEIMLEMLYPEGHPYSWTVIGSMEDLSAASLEDVSEFFRNYYTPNNASLCIAGDIDPVKVKALVEKYYGPIPPGPAVTRLESWMPRLSGVKRGQTEDNVNLPRVYMVWHSPALFAEGDAEMDLLANILTSGKKSRLYKSLVYERQIAQDVAAFQASCELSSQFVIQATAREGHTLDELEAAIDAELTKIFAKGVTAAEVDEARTAYEAGFIRRMQEVGSFGGLADQMNGYNLRLGRPDGFQWDIDRYGRLTAAMVTQTARDVASLENRIILRVVPQGELSAGAPTEELARANLPSPGVEPKFTPPAIARARLDNGLELIVSERHDLPLVQVNLQLLSGWAADPAGRPGAASLTAELLDEGTKKRDALKISEDAKSIGANLSTASFFDGSRVSLNVLKPHLAKGMDLFADVILNPTFPPEELERQREIYLGRIAQEAKQPFMATLKTFQRELFGPDHPYGQPLSGSGTESSINAITRADLVAYYGANYVPNNATLIMVGDITMAEARAMAEKAFASWKPADVQAAEIPTPEAPKKTRICIVDRPGATQSFICAGHLGLRRSDPDFDAFEVMNTALGGQFTSRMNLNLREDKGYTYGTFSTAFDLRGVGPYVCFAPVQAQNTKESVLEIVKEMRDVVGARPLTNAEVADSKSNMIQSYPQSFTTIGQVANQIGELVMFGLPDSEWTDYPKRIAAIDGEAATRAAKERIHPDALLIVIVGDKEKIEPGLRELNLGEVVSVASREGTAR